MDTTDTPKQVSLRAILGCFVLLAVLFTVIAQIRYREIQKHQLDLDLEPLFISIAEEEAARRWRAIGGVATMKDGYIVRVGFYGAKKWSDKHFECLTACQKLERFEAWQLPLLGDEAVRLLSKCPNMNYLGLSGTKITDAALVSLGKMKKLRNLYLSGTNISDKGIRHLSGLSELRRLNLEGTNVSDQGLESIAKLKKLEALRITPTKVSKDAFQRLKATLKNCRVEGPSP